MFPRTIGAVLLTFTVLSLVLGEVFSKSTTKPSSTCGLGLYVTSTGCKLCPLMTYSDTNSSDTACKQCPDDTYTLSQGAVTESLCLECPQNSTSKKGDNKCSPCPKHFVGKCGRCVRCPVGTYIDILSGCKCLKCSHTEIAPNQNSMECEVCPEGLVANEKRTKCILPGCPLGYSHDGYACQPCEFRRYRNKTMATCETCPFGTVGDSYRAARKCVLCPPGEYISDIAPQSRTFDGASYCIPCPPNSTTNGYGKPLCRAINGNCPPNSFLDNENDCQICDFNHRVDYKSRTCVRCPDGYASNQGVADRCQKCPLGATGVYRGRCECKPGRMFINGKCQLCPPGTSYLGSSCYQCEPGYIAPRSGMLECLKCPTGLITVGNDRTRCRPVPSCPKGFFHSFPLEVPYAKHQCVSTRSRCPPRSDAVITNGALLCKNSSGNVVCPPGFFYDNVNLCQQNCRSKYYLTKSGSSKRLSCRQCPRGTYSVGPNAKNCKKCPPGFLGSNQSIRGSTCFCPAGRYIQRRTGACVKCPPGMITDSSDSYKCRECENGFSLVSYSTECVCESPKVLNGTGFCVHDNSSTVQYPYDI